MSAKSTIRSAAVALIACIACAPHAPAQSDSADLGGPQAGALPTVQLISPDLVTDRARLIGIDGDDIVLQFPPDVEHRRPVGEILALIAAEEQDEDPERALERLNRRLSMGIKNPPTIDGLPPLGMLELVDGQLFPGTPVFTATADGAIVWRHPRFGEMEIPLDRVAMFTTRSGPPLPVLREVAAAATGDLVMLSNGDQIAGFLESIAANSVAIEAASGSIELPATGVIAAVVSNPRTAPEGPRIWLDDGTVVRPRHLALDQATGDRGQVIVLDSGLEARYESEWITAWQRDAGQLIALASIPPTSQTGIAPRRHVEPIQTAVPAGEAALASGAILSASNILLPGPMQVSWDLPEGSRRLRATAELQDPSSAWADLELAVLSGGAEVWRTRLNRSNPRALVRVDLHAPDVTFRLEPGAMGPVDDRVVLRRALIEAR